MNGVTIGNVGKLENSQNDEEGRDQDEGKNVQVIQKRASQDASVKKHMMLAEIEEGEEEQQRVIYIDDVTGQELPLHEVRKAREQQLKYFT